MLVGIYYFIVDIHYIFPKIKRNPNIISLLTLTECAILFRRFQSSKCLHSVRPLIARLFLLKVSDFGVFIVMEEKYIWQKIFLSEGFLQKSGTWESINLVFITFSLVKYKYKRAIYSTRTVDFKSSGMNVKFEKSTKTKCEIIDNGFKLKYNTSLFYISESSVKILSLKLFSPEL